MFSNVVHETPSCICSCDDPLHVRCAGRYPDCALLQGGTWSRCNVCEAQSGWLVQSDRPRTHGHLSHRRWALEGNWGGGHIQPKSPKKSSYEATENQHNGRT